MDIARNFLKKKFTNWYAGHLSKQPEKGVKLDEVNVKLLLSTLKPLHAGWLVDFYNEMTTPNGMETIKSGWRASCIQDAITLGSNTTNWSFDDIDPLINDNEAANEANQLQAICASTAEELLLGYSRHEEWQWR